MSDSLMSDSLYLPVDLALSPPWSSTPVSSPKLASAIIESLADAVLVYDAVGRIVFTNPAAASFSGLTLPVRRAASAVPFEEREGLVELLTLEGRPLPHDEWPAVRVLRGETLAGPQTVDAVLQTPNGHERVLNISGAPIMDAQGTVIGAVCVCRDITERKRLERELAERAAELESIFATQVEAVAFIDTTGHIVRMNDAQRQLLAARGIDPAGETIQAWSQKAPPHDALGKPVPLEQLPYSRALRGEAVTGEQAVELYQRMRDGRDLIVRVSGAPVRNARGQIVGVVLSTYDVTPQRQLEQQRMAIMRMVAHDLTNPVAAMRLYLQTQQGRLAQGKSPFMPDDQLLSQMNYALMRMQRLLDDLWVATQVELGTLALQKSRCDIAALCREEAEVQRALTGRAVEVETPPEPVEVDIDKVRIGQVITNLLTNALKYSLPAQPVEVRVRLARGQAYVAVRDTGPGIPAHEQPRLFEQFHRVSGIEAHDGRGGLGLGLYISKAIVTQHGGDMGVESTTGAGSTFWFSLPLAHHAGSGSPH